MNVCAASSYEVELAHLAVQVHLVSDDVLCWKLNALS